MVISKEQVDSDLDNYLVNVYSKPNYQSLGRDLAKRLNAVNIELPYPKAEPSTKEDLANFKAKLRAAGIGIANVIQTPEGNAKLKELQSSFESLRQN